MKMLWICIAIMPSVAAAANRPLPVIVPPNEAAQFSGKSGRVVFDPSCRDYSLKTLSSNPNCAARVKRGETAPSLAIAFGSVKAAANMKDLYLAFAVLENAIKVENHPATHYVLGSLMIKAQIQSSDYALGVRHLELASAGGNAAAADLLGSLVLAGKGVKQDVPRAISLFEQSLAGGFESALTSLSLVYLQGRYKPADAAYGRRLLEAGSAAGYQSASRILQMTDGSGKFHNYQIEPSPDPMQIRVVDYSMLENPEIPPSFGFTESFRKLHYTGLSDAGTLTSLQKDFVTAPTPNLFELARRVSLQSPDQSLKFYLLARVRLTYDSSRCLDAAAMESLGAWNIPIAEELRPILEASTARQKRDAAQAALVEEAKMPADTSPWWVCHSGLASFTEVGQGKVVSLKLKPRGDWPQIRAHARKSLDSLLSSAP